MWMEPRAGGDWDPVACKGVGGRTEVKGRGSGTLSSSVLASIRAGSHIDPFLIIL